eukprot:s2538_g1.t1
MATPRELSLVPTTNAPAASSAAGLGPEPDDEIDVEMTSAPVHAYFQFIQQNVQFIQAGNVDQLMAMAETRHREVMAAAMHRMRERTNATIAKMEEIHSSMVHERDATIENLKKDHRLEIEQYKGFADGEHHKVLEQQKLRLTGEFTSALNETVESATKAIEELTAEHGKQVQGLQHDIQALTEDADRRQEQLKAQYDDAARQNGALQDRIDDLLEQLNRVQTHVSPVPAALLGEPSATFIGVPGNTTAKSKEVANASAVGAAQNPAEAPKVAAEACPPELARAARERIANLAKGKLLEREYPDSFKSASAPTKMIPNEAGNVQPKSVAAASALTAVPIGQTSQQNPGITPDQLLAMI